MPDIPINVAQWITLFISILTVIVCYLRFRRNINKRWIIFLVAFLSLHTITFYLCTFYIGYIDSTLPHSFTEWSSYLRVHAAFTFLCIEVYEYLKERII